ncbi:MAG: hydrogenase maturation protease [Dehalococcoidia bacterium]|nr:hydrogenase maturation protease [Dehalococcoidia bacterium]
MKTVIIGIGSLLRGDDAIGIRIAEAIEREVLPPNVEVVISTAAGLALLDLLTGHDRAVIIDAIQTRRGKPGEVYRLGLEDIPAPLHSFTVHDVSLRSALETGRKMGLPLPSETVIFAVEVANVTPLRESCTPEVQEAIPRAVSLVLGEIGRGG